MELPGNIFRPTLSITNSKFDGEAILVLSPMMTRPAPLLMLTSAPVVLLRELAVMNEVQAMPLMLPASVTHNSLVGSRNRRPPLPEGALASVRPE